MAEESDDNEEKQFSVIKFFRYVSAGIEAVNVAPIDSATLAINKDAYEELGSDSEESDLPFAHIGWEFPTSNTDLVFIMDFYATGMAMCVGSFDYTFSHYEHLGDDEESVARKVVDILVALANGQVSLLCTYTEDDERLQAIEVLYRKPDTQKYGAISTYPMFESKRKLKGREFKTEHFANSSDIDEIKLDDELLAQFLPETQGSRAYNRKQISGLHQPLTREAWESKINAHYEKKSDEIIAKVDKWANKDNLSFMEQVIKYGRWRHLEIVWWSLALLFFGYVISWNLSSIPLQYGGLVLVAGVFTFLSRRTSYLQYLRMTVPFAYLLAALAAFMFLGVSDKGIWWWIFAVCWTFSAVEVVSLDVRDLTKLLPRSKRDKTRMKLK